MVYLHLRASLDDLRRRLVGVLLEVVIKQTAKLRDLLLEVRSTRPALGRV